MTSTVNSTPLLDGPRRSIALGIVMVVLTIMTLDGALTWIAAEEASETIDSVVAANSDLYLTGIDDAGKLLSAEDRITVANGSDGDRLDRDLITTKTLLAVIAVIAAVALTIASGPGSSRNVLAAAIIVAAAGFFVPLVLHADTIDRVTTAHGG